MQAPAPAFSIQKVFASIKSSSVFSGKAIKEENIENESKRPIRVIYFKKISTM